MISGSVPPSEANILDKVIELIQYMIASEKYTVYEIIDRVKKFMCCCDEATIAHVNSIMMYVIKTEMSLHKLQKFDASAKIDKFTYCC